MLGGDKPRLFAAGRMLVIGMVLVLFRWTEASAHEGPPFPILMDQPAAGQVVSVWADPDIGEAQFYIIVESRSGGTPDELSVVMWAEPVSGRLDRVTYHAEQQTLRNHIQFEAKPYFDQRDMWTVGFRITSSEGHADELTTEIESTPPGFGAWDLVIYLFPFLLMGGMWVLAMTRRTPMRSPKRDQKGLV